MLSKAILFTMNQHDIHSRSLRLLSSKYKSQQQQWHGLHGSILIHWVCQLEKNDESLMDRSENSEELINGSKAVLDETEIIREFLEIIREFFPVRRQTYLTHFSHTEFFSRRHIRFDVWKNCFTSYREK